MTGPRIVRTDLSILHEAASLPLRNVDLTDRLIRQRYGVTPQRFWDRVRATVRTELAQRHAPALVLVLRRHLGE